MLFDGYEYDVFISYVRGAAEIDFADVKTYIERKLELMGRDNSVPNPKTSVFLDDADLPSNGTLTAECRRAAASSAFLVCFISVGYAGSRYCAEEISAFVEAARARGRDDWTNRLQLIQVEEDADIPALPDEISRLLREQKRLELYDADGTISSSLDADGKSEANSRFSREMAKVCRTFWKRARSAQLLPATPQPVGPSIIEPPPPNDDVQFRKRVAIGFVDPGLDQIKQHRQEIFDELSRFGLDVYLVDDGQLGTEMEQIASALRDQLSTASLLILIASGSEHRFFLPLLGAQRSALPDGARCQILHLGGAPLPFSPRERTDPPTIVENDAKKAAEAIRRLVTPETGDRPWILAAATNVAVARYAGELQDRIDKLWGQRNHGAPAPEIIARTLATINDNDINQGEIDGFVALYVAVQEKSFQQYYRDILMFVQKNQLNKESAVAVFPPSERPAWLRLKVINCNPTIDESQLEQHLDLVWHRWRGRAGAAA